LNADNGDTGGDDDEIVGGGNDGRCADDDDDDDDNDSGGGRGGDDPDNKNSIKHTTMSVLLFQTIAPGIPLPPQPVLTRWKTWLDAVNYYVEHYGKIMDVIDALNSTDSSAVAAVKSLPSEQLLEDILFIDSDLKSCPKASPFGKAGGEETSILMKATIPRERIQIHKTYSRKNKKECLFWRLFYLGISFAASFITLEIVPRKCVLLLSKQMIESLHDSPANKQQSSKAIGLEVNPEKTKYMIMSRDQDIVRNGNIKTGGLSFEEVEKFKYLGATVTNINDTREEIKRRINMGNACYYSVEKLLSSSLLSKNLKVRIYKTVILPVLLYGCETWTLTLREEHRLRVFENKVLRKIFGAKRDEVTGEWRKLHNTELHALYSSPDIIRNIESRRMRWAGHVARMGESRNAYRVLVGRPEGKRPLGRPRRRWEDNIKMDLREVEYDDRDWINLAQDRDCWRAYVRAAMNLRKTSKGVESEDSSEVGELVSETEDEDSSSSDESDAECVYWQAYGRRAKLIGCSGTGLVSALLVCCTTTQLIPRYLRRSNSVQIPWDPRIITQADYYPENEGFIRVNGETENPGFQQHWAEDNMHLSNNVYNPPYQLDVQMSNGNEVDHWRGGDRNILKWERNTFNPHHQPLTKYTNMDGHSKRYNNMHQSSLYVEEKPKEIDCEETRAKQKVPNIYAPRLKSGIDQREKNYERFSVPENKKEMRNTNGDASVFQPTFRPKIAIGNVNSNRNPIYRNLGSDSANVKISARENVGQGFPSPTNKNNLNLRNNMYNQRYSNSGNNRVYAQRTGQTNRYRNSYYQPYQPQYGMNSFYENQNYLSQKQQQYNGQNYYNQLGQNTYNQLGQLGQNNYNQLGQNNYNQLGQNTYNQLGQLGQNNYNQLGQNYYNQLGQNYYNNLGQNYHNNLGQNYYNKLGQNYHNQYGQNYYNPTTNLQWSDRDNSYKFPNTYQPWKTGADIYNNRYWNQNQLLESDTEYNGISKKPQYYPFLDYASDHFHQPDDYGNQLDPYLSPSNQQMQQFFDTPEENDESSTQHVTPKPQNKDHNKKKDKNLKDKIKPINSQLNYNQSHHVKTRPDKDHHNKKQNKHEEKENVTQQHEAAESPCTGPDYSKGNETAHETPVHGHNMDESMNVSTTNNKSKGTYNAVDTTTTRPGQKILTPLAKETKTKINSNQSKIQKSIILTEKENTSKSPTILDVTTFETIIPTNTDTEYNVTQYGETSTEQQSTEDQANNSIDYSEKDYNIMFDELLNNTEETQSLSNSTELKTTAYKKNASDTLAAGLMFSNSNTNTPLHAIVIQTRKEAEIKPERIERLLSSLNQTTETSENRNCQSSENRRFALLDWFGSLVLHCPKPNGDPALSSGLKALDNEGQDFQTSQAR
ncbi:hypothetical protein ANN_16456, partial [Periplaneta americana]